MLDRCKVGGKEEMYSMQIHKARENRHPSAAWQSTVTEELLLKMWKILFTLRHITEAARFTQQKWEYCENKSIGEYEKKLDPEQFFRIHKSIIINLDKVREVLPWGSNSFSLACGDMKIRSCQLPEIRPGY